MSIKGAEMNISPKTKQTTDKWQCREQEGGTFPGVFSCKWPLQSLQLLHRVDHWPDLSFGFQSEVLIR